MAEVERQTKWLVSVNEAERQVVIAALELYAQSLGCLQHKRMAMALLTALAPDVARLHAVSPAQQQEEG